MSQDWEKINQKFVWLKVASINISRSTVPDCTPLLVVPFLFDIERNWSLLKPKWITFQESFSKYLMNTIYFNKHDVDIFINGTWQKYGDSSKLQGYLNFAFDQREIEVNLHKATSSSSNVSPASRPFLKPTWW
jgi:hypothetical protein